MSLFQSMKVRIPAEIIFKIKYDTAIYNSYTYDVM